MSLVRDSPEDHPYTMNAAQFVQRLLAGCPVKEPDPVDFDGYREIPIALYRAWQSGGVRVAHNAWRAMSNADPALRGLMPDEERMYGNPQALDEAALQSLDAFECTEAGQSEAFCFLFKGTLCFLPGEGWMIWTGQRWRKDDREAVVQFAVMAARARREAVSNRPMPEGSEEERAARRKGKDADLRWTMGAENLGRIKNILGISRTHPELVIPSDRFDQDRHLLGVANGIVDLRTGQLVPARPEQLITLSNGVPYFPDAQAPRFERFLHEIFDGDSDLVAFVQRAVGYSLTGETSEQCFFICYGSGANGKSTLLNVLKGIAGEYAANTPFQTFEHGRQSSTGQELVALRGKRLVLSSETNEGTRLNEARIKAITGGDEITGRYLYERTAITFVPVFKIWFASNHRPTITGHDEGIWRRVRLLPFLVSFPEHKRDKHLEAELSAEQPGILAWAVRGAMAWYSQGLGEPTIVEQATRAYREENDILGQYLAECVIRREGATTQSSRLYESYQQWAAGNGLYTMSNVKFSRALKERGYGNRRENAGVMWQDVELRGAEDSK